MVTLNSITTWMSRILACMGGCFGCCAKATPVIAVDEPSKGLRIQGRSVKRAPPVSDGFWSSSTCDFENSAAMSQRSASSISISYQTTLCHGPGGTSTTHPDFVNHGHLLWNQTRLQWSGSGKTRNQAKQTRERHLSWNATYESLLTTKHPFRHPIPLSEMVEFLVDVWEHEGLYD